MSAVLYFDSPLPDTFYNDTVREKGAITVEGSGVYVELNESTSWQVDGYGKTRVAADVMEVREFVPYSDKAVSEASISYHFPLTALTESIPSPTRRHWRFGFIRGDLDGTGKIDAPEPIRLTLGGQDFLLDKKFDFYKSGGIRYPEQLVVTQSFLGFEIDRVEDIELTVQNSREMAEQLVRLMSLVEGDRIRWTNEEIAARVDDKTMAFTSSTTRWVSPPKPRSLRFRYGRDYLGSFALVVNTYDKLNAQDRQNVMRAIGEFEIAHCAPTIESALIYWHSVLDFLRGRLGHGGNPISLKLYKLCQSRDVDLTDIGTEETLKAISSGDRKARFDFTRLRNEFIHDGFDVFEGRYNEVIRAREQARALAERLLLSLMNIDYRDTILGNVEFETLPPVE